MSQTLKADVARAFLPLIPPRRYKGAHGGRGSAKSHFFAEQIILRCYGKPTRAVCIREVQNSLKESVRQLLIDKIEKFGLGHAFQVLEAEIRGANGSLIIFKGMQSYNSESIKSLEGFDIAWVEEAQTLSAISLRLLRPTIRNPGSELWFSWNPRYEHDPVDEFFRGESKHPDALAIEVNWTDNPWFPSVLKDEMTHDRATDPEMAAHVWDGGYEKIAKGSYYGKDIALAETEKRIGSVPYDRASDVFASWDLGIGDMMAIWFGQVVGREWHWIGYYENSGFGLDHYVDYIKGQRFPVHHHYLPHDGDARELQTGKSRREYLEGRGFRTTIVPQHAVDDGINAARSRFNRMWFDKEACKRGIDCLRMYRSEFDEKAQVLKSRPLHDWASHGADAFRCGVMGAEEKQHRPRPAVRHAAGGWMG